MKQLKKDLQALSKSLKQLTRKAEQTMKRLEKLEKPQARKVRARPGGKPGRVTATDAIFDIIKKSRRGVTTEQIKAKTGFKERKIWDTVNRLKRQDKVKKGDRGLYVKV